MRVLSVLGSPRKMGNTAKVLTWIDEELQSLGHQVDRVNVVDYKINGCLGCMRCQQVMDEPGCVQKDDMQGIHDKILAADAIILASGLYVWSVPGQLKSLLDRFFCLVKGSGGPNYKSLIQDKKGVVLVTCGGPIEGNADFLLEMYHRFAGYANMPPLTELVVPFCTSPDNMGEDIKMQATQLAKEISG